MTCLVTISRGTKSGGILLAEAAGNLLGAGVLSRRDLLARHPALGEMESELREELSDRPEYLDDALEPLRRAYLALLRAALLERAAEGPLVYHGNGGHLLLAGAPGLLRVRVVAPMAQRLELVQQRRGGSALQASRYIHHKDRRRARWNTFLYGVASLDDALYHDLVLNLGRFGVERAARLVADTAAAPPFAAPEAEAQQQRGDLTLAARVRAALCLQPNTRMALLEVRACRGSLEIIGETGQEALAEEVRQVAGGVEGVERIALSFSGAEPAEVTP